jgi:hypothetical protein
MKIKAWIVNLLDLALLLQAAQTRAWEQISCITPINKDKKKHWAESVYKPVLDPVTLPEGSPQYFAVLEAIDRMNRNPSQFRLVGAILTLFLEQAEECNSIALEKNLGQTQVVGQGLLDAPSWHWPDKG